MLLHRHSNVLFWGLGMGP